MNKKDNAYNIKTLFCQKIVFVFLLLSSCHKDPIMRFGFDCDFGKKSQGLIIMNVGNDVQTLNLSGNIFIAEGDILVELINPIGETAFSSQKTSPGTFHIDESFHAIKGKWKLKYRSMDGEGSILLHLIITN